MQVQVQPQVSVRLVPEVLSAAVQGGAAGHRHRTLRSAAAATQHRNSIDRDGIDSDGIDRDGINSDDIDSDDIDSDGIDSDGIDSDGIDGNGIDSLVSDSVCVTTLQSACDTTAA